MIILIIISENGEFITYPWFQFPMALEPKPKLKSA